MAPPLQAKLESSQTFSKKRWIKLFAIFVAATSLLWVIWMLTGNHPTAVRAITDRFSSTSGVRSDPIPNIVHYTMIQKDEKSQFSFSLKYFLSIYSAHIILRPEIIYIHTTFSPSLIEQAQQSGNRWTRAALDPSLFPEVKMNYITVTSEVNGITVERPEAKSDFARWDQLYKTGGIYMDFDVYVLRNAAPLREAGFKAIVGREPGGMINTGVVMTMKGSKLAALMDRDQYKTFDGGYVTHAVLLLTPLAERLVWTPWEVLILDTLAMAPSGFSDPDVKRLYEYHEDSVSTSEQINDHSLDAFSRWDAKKKGKDWEMDFSSTYFLHAFRRHTDEEMPYYTGMTVKKLLDRNSNLGLALWDVLQAGLEEGVFDADDDDPE